MGYYELSLSKMMTAVIEQNNDKDGIIWPAEIAPFKVAIVPVSIVDKQQKEKAFAIYDFLNTQGIEAVIDDRDERAGVKFRDADLIGYPLRITIGPNALQENVIECKMRRTGEVKYISIDNYVVELIALTKQL